MHGAKHEDMSRNFKFDLNLTRITVTLHEDPCTSMISRCLLLRMKNGSDKAVKKIKSHFMFNTFFFPKIVPIVR